ncbi:MAG: carboxypeptidase-like regulatory domain-containing protein, partial [bacterium]|nr:carboxypeptidase-like regulatory domain-containing protein [bacterium]
GGTIIIHAVDAEFQPIQSAQVRIANSTVNPAIDLTTFTDELGTASVLGAPPAGGYAITVTKGGYSSAQTYGVTATNTNPIPAHLGVGGYQTTAATFEIDRLSSLHVETYEKIKDESWDDLFTDDSNVSLTDVEITGGRAELAGSEGSYAASGTVISIAPSIPYLYRWQEITWNDIVPGGTDIVYRVYDAGGEPLSNGELQGNTAGFTSPPINISGVSTSTHALLKVGATLATSDASTTPSIQDWTVSYEVGPEPLSDIDFNLHGGKTIGTEAGGSLIYKYDVDHTTNAEGLRDISNIEWDLYTISVSASTGYDIASSCPPQSVGIVPEAAVSVRLYLAAHTTNSLLVDVRASDGTLIDGASIRLYRGSYDTTLTSDECGQEIFSSLSVGSVGAGNPYSIEVSASGYTSYTSTEVNVSGTTRLSIILN